MLSQIERQLIERYQRGLPLTPRPFAEMARTLGTDEQTVIQALENLQARGVLSRVGAVFDHGRLGASTLAAMQVPESQIEQTAALVSGYKEVNHNYLRNHRLNLWFVVNARDEHALTAVLEELHRRSGFPVLAFPMQAAYHIDLGFTPEWQPDGSALNEGSSP